MSFQKIYVLFIVQKLIQYRICQIVIFKIRGKIYVAGELELSILNIPKKVDFMRLGTATMVRLCLLNKRRARQSHHIAC